MRHLRSLGRVTNLKNEGCQNEGTGFDFRLLWTCCACCRMFITTFSRTWIFFLLRLSVFELLSSSLLSSDSSHLCFSSVHSVRSLTSRLPSVICNCIYVLTIRMFIKFRLLYTLPNLPDSPFATKTLENHRSSHGEFPSKPCLITAVKNMVYIYILYYIISYYFCTYIYIYIYIYTFGKIEWPSLRNTNIDIIRYILEQWWSISPSWKSVAEPGD